MQLLRKLAAAVSTTALSLITAVSVAAQQAKIEVKTTDSSGAWYTQPVWIAIGVIALILIIVLISLAGRGRSNTTVVK
jgi:cell division protein FtsW (lipid II flippase)